MGKEKTPNPNVSEEISKEISVNPENQRGLSVSRGKSKIETENFSPEGGTNKEFDIEGWKGIQAEKQKEIDNRLEKKTSNPAPRSSIKKGFSFKLPKLGWLGIATIVYEAGSQIYEAYQNFKKEDDLDATSDKEPENITANPKHSSEELENQIEQLPSNTPEQNQGKEPTEPLSKNDESLLENPEVNEKAQIEVDRSEDRLASFFRDEQQEVKMDDLPEISDKQKESLYVAFNENAKNLPEIEDENSGFQPEQNEIIEYGDNERIAAFFRGDDQEIETNDLSEISEEQKNSFYLAFNEEREDSEIEDYFPVDLYTSPKPQPSKSRDFDCCVRTVKGSGVE